MSIIRDPALAEHGRMKIEWVQDFMPALSSIRARFEREKPFAGRRITMSIHLEAKTAYLALCLLAGGAEVHATGCNPLSTQDDVAAGLASLGVNVYAWHGATPEEYTAHLSAALACHPDLIIDDGGRLPADQMNASKTANAATEQIILVFFFIISHLLRSFFAEQSCGANKQNDNQNYKRECVAELRKRTCLDERFAYSD